ncbi:MAG: hypothetical protein ACR2IN_01405 [Thermoleophilaceae bacterium]
MTSSPNRPFPRRTLENALRIPRALREHNGGQPWPPAEVARALDLGAQSGNFFYLTSAAKQYGLTEGTSRTSEIALTELGRRAVFPSSAEEERAALRDAFLNVQVFRQVLQHYGGNNLPDAQYRENTLYTNYSLDPTVQDEFVELLDKNCRFVGIGETFSGDGRADGGAPRAEAAKAETIATPKAAAAGTAPTCFVIMPFVERDDRNPPGFFREVLESLFTPAITSAGLQVRTAQRQGSDVIQSTIIKELLEADLVLADLTEHNPNVLFELGMRIAEDKPTALVRAKGTGQIFDVDYLLRVEDYSPNVWPSTVKRDVPRLQAHIKAAWDNRTSDRTYRGILLGGGAPTDGGAPSPAA